MVKRSDPLDSDFGSRVNVDSGAILDDEDDRFQHDDDSWRTEGWNQSRNKSMSVYVAKMGEWTHTTTP